MIKMSDEYSKLRLTVERKYIFLLYDLSTVDKKLIFNNLKSDLLYINSFDKYNVTDLEKIDSLLSIIAVRVDDIKNIYKKNKDLSEKEILFKVVEYYKQIITVKIKETELLLRNNEDLLDEYAKLKDYLVYLDYIDSNDVYKQLSVIRDYEINLIDNYKNNNTSFDKNKEKVLTNK